MKSVTYRGRPETMCWECEALTTEPVETALGSLASYAARVVLCPDCYRACYVPLVTGAARSAPMAR